MIALYDSTTVLQSYGNQVWNHAIIAGSGLSLKRQQ